jgi:hypothetical protein
MVELPEHLKPIGLRKKEDGGFIGFEEHYGKYEKAIFTERDIEERK